MPNQLHQHAGPPVHSLLALEMQDFQHLRVGVRSEKHTRKCSVHLLTAPFSLLTFYEVVLVIK